MVLSSSKSFLDERDHLLEPTSLVIEFITDGFRTDINQMSEKIFKCTVPLQHAITFHSEEAIVI